ncbi:MAG: type I glyceraldehyde-3-phosphate dehydrogenase [Leptospiraceae bacterium]|nr:type I glyceraldehyde-3-phosphate dehydrogenase [Leptospiraceae bacterium]MCB1202066.1 type I glyceraldehyde-3-phosphate dehydrogenase [Leptospiraceae bacterium]
MAKLKIGINGFGRIGRNVFKAANNNPDIEIVAINDLTDNATLAHLLKYDSVFGVWDHEVSHNDDFLIVDGKKVHATAIPKLEELKWKDFGVDIVIESTGRFTDANKARAHIDAGAKYVIISAPAKNEDATFVMGVNEKDFNKDKHKVISNASCTTNCLAPFAKVLLEKFGIVKGMMTTIHSYTNDQMILDLPHKDLRRSRAAALSMIPTTTGAAKAVSLVLPSLKGKLDGMAVRVPTPNVSLVDLVIQTEKDTTKEEVNAALKAAAEGELKGILGYSDLPLVSRDFLGNPLSSVIDGDVTNVVGGNLVKVLSWYDNEWGYSSRTVDLAALIAKSL